MQQRREVLYAANWPQKFPPNSSILLQNSVLEDSLSLFSMHMGYVIPDRARHSEIELSNLNTYGGIASFFFNEIKRILRRSKDALKIRKKLFFLKLNTIDTPTTSFYIRPLMEKYLVEAQPIYQASPPLSRCIYSETSRF